MNTKMEQALGGKTAIRDNANAFILRASKMPFLDPQKQPVIYAILKKLADKQGITPEQYQEKMDKTFY